MLRLFSIIHIIPLLRQSSLLLLYTSTSNEGTADIGTTGTMTDIILVFPVVGHFDW